MSILTVLVIVSVFVSTAFGLYYLQQTSEINQLKAKLVNEESSIASLTNQMGSLQSSTQTVQSQLNHLNSQLNNLQEENSSRNSSDSQLQSQITRLNQTVVSLESELAQIPGGILVVTSSSFDAETSVTTLVIKNTLNETVSAQLFVRVFCLTPAGSPPCTSLPIGYYSSGVTEFSPLSTTPLSFPLSQIIWNGPRTAQMSINLFMAEANNQISPSYTLQFP